MTRREKKSEERENNENNGRVLITTTETIEGRIRTQKKNIIGCFQS